MADVVALGRGRAAVAGVLGAGDAYGWRGEQEAWRHSWGEEDGDMRRWWRTWWRSGEREQREQNRGELWRRLGERKRCECELAAGGGRWCRGEQESVRWECCAVGERERWRLLERASLRGRWGHSGDIGGAWGASRGGGGYSGGGGGEVPRSPRTCRVGVLFRVRWVWQRRRQVVGG